MNPKIAPGQMLECDHSPRQSEMVTFSGETLLASLAAQAQVPAVEHEANACLEDLGDSGFHSTFFVFNAYFE